jgi:hypothetical protein
MLTRVLHSTSISQELEDAAMRRDDDADFDRDRPLEYQQEGEGLQGPEFFDDGAGGQAQQEEVGVLCALRGLPAGGPDSLVSSTHSPGLSLNPRALRGLRLAPLMHTAGR